MHKISALVTLSLCLVFFVGADVSVTLDSNDGSSNFNILDSDTANIGSIDSNGKLTLAGSAEISAGIKIGNSSDNVNGTIRYTGTDLEGRISGSWITLTGGGDFADGGEAGTADRSLGNTDNYDLSFLTNNQTRLHLQNDGNIGIGTTSPSTTLEIVGTTKGIVPYWTVTACDANNYSNPAQFVTPLATWSQPSFGSIVFGGDSAWRWNDSNSLLHEMTVRSIGAQTKTLKLFVNDNHIYVWLRGATVFSRTTNYDSTNSPINVTLNLTDGDNLIQIVTNDVGGSAAYLVLMGDIIDNENVFFIEP